MAGRVEAGLFEGPARAGLERDALVPYLQRQRWFGGKARGVRAATFSDWTLVQDAPSPVWLTAIDVRYEDGGVEQYHAPLAGLSGTEAEALARESPGLVLARLPEDPTALLGDATAIDDVCRSLVAAAQRPGRISGRRGVVRAVPTGAADAEIPAAMPVDRLPSLHSNTAVTLGDRYLLKVFRRVEFGLNPDVEIGRFLERVKFVNVPALLGSLEYEREGRTATVVLVQRLVPSRTSGWDEAQAEVRRFLTHPVVAATASAGDPRVIEAAGRYRGACETLGRRTAELHAALASDPADPDFAAEPATGADVDRWVRGMVAHLHDVLDLLERQQPSRSSGADRPVHDVLAARHALAERLALLGRGMGPVTRIRIHGDYHLGQVLALDGDFVLLDFEGEPARTLAERRAKQPVLRDVAGMLRSFSYAAWAGVFEAAGRDPDRRGPLEMAARAWEAIVSAAFLRGYFSVPAAAALVPADRSRAQAALDLFVLDKALYELRYELNNRPDWVQVPAAGLLAALQPDAARATILSAAIV